MDGIEASGEGRVVADQGRRIRRNWTTEIKRRIVREAEKPGAVKQQVAERHGLHVSVLNRWRTELAIRSSGAKKVARKARLVPVRVSKTHRSRAPSRPLAAPTTAMIGTDTMEVALPAGQRVVIRGVVNGEVLRTVLQELARC
jgi:transposase